MSNGLNRRQIIATGLGGAFALTSEGANAQGQTQLTFWTVRLNTPELAAALRGILAEFEKANPGIKITHEPVSGTLVYPKFLAAVRGQSMPDVAEAYVYHPIQFAAMDQMEPMDDIMAEWKADGKLDQVANEFAYRKNFWKGHYWAVPYNLDIRPFYYRRDLFEAKGVKPPTNWDEFQAAAIALNDPANGVFGLVFPAGDFHITQHFYAGFMFQAGGGVVDEESKLAFGTKFKDANVRALTFLTDLATKHKVTPPGIASYNAEDPHTLFVQGRAAMCMGTGGLIGRIMREAPALFDKTGVLDVLEGPAGPPRRLVAGFYQGMFVWKYSPQKEAAKTFIRWFVQPGRLDPVYRAAPGTHWPIFKQEIAAPRVQENRLLREALEKVVARTTDFAFPGAGVPAMAVVDGEKLFSAPVNRVVAGGVSPEKAVMDAHAVMARVFES